MESARKVVGMDPAVGALLAAAVGALDAAVFVLGLVAVYRSQNVVVQLLGAGAAALALLLAIPVMTEAIYVLLMPVDRAVALMMWLGGFMGVLSAVPRMLGNGEQAEPSW